MIKIKASPLVIAAALGLLGPAALSEDEDTEELGGLWQRSSETGLAGESSAVPGQLGNRIQLLPLDDRYVLDEGNGRDAGVSTWSTEPIVLQTFHINNSAITREFHPDGDALEVVTVVSTDGESIEYTDLYTRVDKLS